MLEDAGYSYRVFSDADIAAAEKEELTISGEIEKAGPAATAATEDVIRF